MLSENKVKPEQFKAQSRNKEQENKKFLARLRKKDSRKVDAAFHSLHEQVFSEVDCLKCANCCKTTSPIFYQNDIERVAKSLRMKPGDFVEKYLKIDDDRDYVLKSSPCPFLDAENYCTVYHDRPRACREYPHTDRKKMAQITELTLKNTMVCPAVFEIVERLKNVPI
jgi:Fe-S-cluster containining protein